MFNKLCNIIVAYGDEVSINTFQLDIDVSIITGHTIVPIIFSIDMNNQWCSIINGVNLDIHAKWKKNIQMGNWSDYFPVTGMCTHATTAFESVWGNAGNYSHVEDWMYDKYTLNNDMFTKCGKVVSPNLPYGSFILIPLYSEIKEYMILNEVCQVGEIIGNGMLRQEWESYYYRLIQSLLNGKLEPTLLDKKTILILSNLIYGHYDESNMVRNTLLYRMSSISVRLDEVTGFLIRGYITIPNVMKVGKAFIDAYMGEDGIYASEIYAGRMHFDDNGCTIIHDIVLCGRYQNDTRRYSLLVNDVSRKYDLKEIRKLLNRKVRTTFRHDNNEYYLGYADDKADNMLWGNMQWISSKVVPSIDVPTGQNVETKSKLYMKIMLLTLSMVCICLLAGLAWIIFEMLMKKRKKQLKLRSLTVDSDMKNKQKCVSTQVDMVTLGKPGMNDNRIRVVK